MNKENNLPLIVNDNLPIEKKRNFFRIKNKFQRTGKILANLGISAAALGAMSLGGPVIPAIGATVYFITATNALKDIVFKKEKGLMFVTSRDFKGEISISQDSTDFKGFSKMKGFQPGEKATLMGLQMLMGLQYYKQQFKDQDKKTEVSRNGTERVYSQIFKTITHGVNIKTIEALEKLGYIQIERNKPIKQSILFFERMEFKQYKEAREALIARITGNQGKLHEYKKQMNEVAFRITDKQIDFEEIYRQYQELRNTRGNNPLRKPIRRIGILFEGLRNRNIDIQQNNLGMYEINYNARESFAKRIERECSLGNKAQAFRDEQKSKGEDLIREQSDTRVETPIRTENLKGEERG